MSNSLEEKLGGSASQWNNLISLLPGVMFRQRPDLGFSWATSRIAEFTGLPTMDLPKLPAQNFWKIVHEADVGELQQRLAWAANSNQVCVNAFRIRHLVTRQVRCVRELRQAVRDDKGALLGFDCIWLDVTKEMIAQRLRSSTDGSEALARLADGLAHDINNLMMGIHALAESFQSQIAADHPFQESLQLIEHNAMQARKIVQRIVDLDHGKSGTRRFENLNDLLTDTLELVRKIVPRRIQIEIALARETLPVYVDAVEFREAILKLTLNAISAMGQGGKLRFQTSRQAMALPLDPQGAPPPEPKICLAVTDSGIGMTAELANEMPHPYSSTKPLGQASGIGLFTVAHFVEIHGGTLSVESVEGQGTTVRLWFPEANFSETAAQPSNT